jgi:NAD(P)-dependent dehydrogenase (short-subunit alcohol dehydrogenase family)
MWAYSHSKLANVLFAAELGRRLDAAGRSLTSNSIHPGAIPGSGFSRFLPGPLPRLVQLLDAVPGVTSVADGAAELLFPAVSPHAADISGRYFSGQQPTPPAAAGQDTAAARRLWEYSADVIDIEEPLREAVQKSE